MNEATDEIVRIPGAVPAKRSVIEAKRAERLVELQRAREWLAAATADGWTRQEDSTDDYHKLKRGDFVAHVIVREDSTIGWRLPEGSVHVWGDDGNEHIETPWPYSWEAINAKFCGHDYEHLATVANCLNRYRCRKCGAVHDIDSGD